MMNNIYDKILIMNYLAIGDLVFSTPLIRVLKESYPQAEIHMSIWDKTANIIKSSPYIDKFIYFSKEGPPRSLDRYKGYFKYIKKIRKEKYDLVIGLQDNKNIALFSWLSGAKKRIGFARKKRGKFYTDYFSPKRQMHNVDYYLQVAKILNLNTNLHKGLEVCINETQKRFANQFLLKHKVGHGDNKLIGLNVGARFEVKCWPIQKFVELGNKLVDELGVNIIFLGGPKEEDRSYK
ncbi:Glycosyltransferase family 9 (heptosyltransferase) [Candidatus Frackibacter sp. WG12]|nr:Glycosyltransferase family 9 (heptosyltransferase) [Candidatus Frackibacter sp. WG11]SEM38169.1 Glycosyltransferase family 9 (heptosyltransferase) [Candidatus Frackibacter sp. WG12]SFL43708.1 Glycosyltransferase family 9 (heptosyltransferase) [Candidatus Frackibacter sp. WG13]